MWTLLYNFMLCNLAVSYCYWSNTLDLTWLVVCRWVTWQQVRLCSCADRLRHTYTSAAAAERSVLLVNYENQRNAFKLVDIKPPPSPSTVNDVIYTSPRHWMRASPNHLVVQQAALYPAGDDSEHCDCVYSSDLRPCGCPRLLQTFSALSASQPDVTSELQYVGSADDDHDQGDVGPEVYVSRDGGGGNRPGWQSSTVCRGCANVDAGPVPATLSGQPEELRQVVDGSATCWRSDEDATCCLTTPQRRQRTSSISGVASNPVPVIVTSRQTSTWLVVAVDLDAQRCLFDSSSFDLDNHVNSYFTAAIFFSFQTMSMSLNLIFNLTLSVTLNLSLTTSLLAWHGANKFWISTLHPWQWVLGRHRQRVLPTFSKAHCLQLLARF